jgi:hypothetical protein
MNLVVRTFRLVFALTLLCGCGSGPRPTETTAASTPPATQVTLNIAGNWQFSATSTLPRELPFTIAGSISQNGATLTSALHIGGSKCFDRLTTIGFSGTVSAGTTSLISTDIEGQVITLTGNFDNTAFAGTYRINGGCADGEMGKVIGNNIPYAGNTLSGSLTNSANKTFDVVAEIAQSSNASSEGSFELSGTGTFDTPCFKSGTIKPGVFPSGSFILGTTVSLQFETGNGTLAFLGTLSQDRSRISGNYAIEGGTCDDSGTAVLSVSSPWDY